MQLISSFLYKVVANRAGYAKRRPHAPNPLVLVPKPLLDHPEKPTGWDFYRNVLKNPKYIAAPMVCAYIRNIIAIASIF